MMRKLKQISKSIQIADGGFQPYHEKLLTLGKWVKSRHRLNGWMKKPFSHGMFSFKKLIL